MTAPPLDDKVAIVAAASQGLGKASALALARKGASVTLFARGEETLAATAQEVATLNAGRVHAAVADLRQLADLERVVDETVQRFGGVDILVNNSGGPAPGPFMDVTDQEWLDALDAEVMGAVRLCRLTIPYMRQRGGGRIINIATVGVMKPQPGLVLSDATRHLVVGLGLNLAAELAAENILVNTVCPGPIRTERMEDLIRDTATRENLSLGEAEQRWLDLVPLRRLGEPEDVGELVAFLASETGRFITGAVIQVDGGKAIA